MPLILAVDDNPINLQVIVADLRREDYRVVTAADGPGCLELARERQPDTILLDYRMPGMDGLATLRHLKGDPGTKNIPVIIVSAEGDEEAIVAGLDAGAQDYITKPYSPSLVHARLRAAVNLRRAFVEQQQSQMLATVGTLAGGIAHEFNNLNTIVLGNVELALRDRGLPEKARKRLLTIRDAAKRGAGITGNLLDLVRSDGNESGEPVSVPRVVKNTVKLCRKTLVDAGVSVVRQKPPEPACVAMSESALSQALLNLIINAVHAMRGRDERELSIRTAVSDDLVAVDVQDSGRGIPPEALEKIFLPFYSTKGVHADGNSPESRLQGTGLGLSVVSRLVEQAGGKISVESRTGEGTRFRIVLPRVAVDEEPQRGSSTSIHLRSLKGGRVLFADDEADIREVLNRILVDAGAEVVLASDGAQALERCAEEEIDVILLDWSMPRMGGREFILAADREIGPEHRPDIVVCTGLITDADRRFLREHDVYDVLIKPVGQTELLTTLAKYLDKAPTR